MTVGPLEKQYGRYGMGESLCRVIGSKRLSSKLKFSKSLGQGCPCLRVFKETFYRLTQCFTDVYQDPYMRHETISGDSHSF